MLANIVLQKQLSSRTLPPNLIEGILVIQISSLREVP